MTSEQLLCWSAPIDLAEAYEIDSITSEFFYNCSEQWFGSVCQYKFPFDPKLSFTDIVDATHRVRQSQENFNASGTCYPFINTCNDELWPLCLHWREVCDAKIDCSNGEDEHLCQQLDVNTCKDDEYRCHYGGQCITRQFVDENPESVDWLDGSDEASLHPTPLGSAGLSCHDMINF